MSDIRFNRWLHQSGTGGVYQDSSGNVGVGTSVPRASIDIAVGSASSIRIGTAITISHSNGIQVGSSSLHSTGLNVQSINSTGIITATTFSGNLNSTGVTTVTTLNIGTGTSISSPATNVLTLGTNNVERVRIDSSGNLGIGTNNPRFRLEVGAVGASGTSLHVNGDARVTGILSVGQGTITINGNTDKITTPKLDYAGISSTISDNAVDVFVYDTRKDSDGGAWRKRTQHTSWYNETLNTATRGSRRDFPAVAVIVVTTNTITIYDGDDPDMPIWMKFTDGFNTYLGMGIGGLTSVAMLNGVMVHGGQYDVHVTNFISDKTNRYGDNSGIAVNHTQPISGRNNDTAGNYNGPTTPIIANRQVYDVAMTVLPNAPIDSTTGLPVPTIAVATQGGLSIIKDDGTVISATSTSGGAYSYVKTLTITDERYLWFLADSFDSYNTLRDSYALSLDALPSSNFTWDNATDNLTAGLYYAVTTANEGGEIKIGPVNTWSWSKQERNALGGPSGLAIHKPNIGAETNSLVVGITSTYNTGWMHGDIKGAFLSDTSTTSVTGTNLVTNGDFASGTTGWTGGTGGTLSVTSGVLRVTNTGTNGRAISNTFSTVVGKKYVLTADGVTKTTSNYYMEVRGPELSATWASGTGALYFTAVGSTTYVELYALGSASTYSEYDNVSVRIVEDDRSVNNKGLQVFGTITKTAVATGADLVAYGGWSGSNYLYQPYNSSFNFGTGDFCIMCWVKESNFASNQFNTIIDIAQTGSNTGRIEFLYAYSNLRITLSGSNTTSSLSSPTNTWLHVAAVRTGGTINLYENGVLTTTGASTNNFNNTSVNTYIGINYSGGNAGTGKQISLLRISSSAPSADQIKKIYNDEKMLFQENSKATLYGTSSAVTALAYDDSTRLLYAGTSSGRSDFQGLERINNTTTAVTTAISASNGLVAEQ